MRREVLVLLFAINVLLAILTSLYSFITIPVPYAAGSSPINPGRFGTSRFVQVLRGFGLDVVYVSNWSTLELADTRRVAAIVISPEIPYTTSEAKALARLLKSFGGVVLVADEDVGSNRVLEELGVSARISGRRLLDEVGNFHPRATFHIGSRAIGIRLDKASEVVNCEGVALGYAESYTYPGATMELRAVGCLEVREGVAVLILSDGSLLTNQALNLGGSYADLATAIAREVSNYCGSRCVALVESGKYLSDRALFERMLMEGDDKVSEEVYLNEVLHLVNLLRNLLISGPTGLEEEFLALTLVLVALIFLSVKVGLAIPGRTTARVTPVWRGTGDLAKIRKAILDIIEISRCPTEGSELIRCLEMLGYSRPRELAKFLRESETVLRSRLLRYTPLVPLLIRRAVKYSRELVELLEKSLGAGTES